MGLKFWDGFRIYVDQNKPEDFQYIQIFDLLKTLKDKKNLSAKDIAFGRKVLGFIQENPTLTETIKALSAIEDSEIIEVKFIYDKLLLLSKEDWKRIIDVASQTKIFNNLELSNIKSVQTALSKKEKIKEQAVIKAFESLKKLKKFGISI